MVKRILMTVLLITLIMLVAVPAFAAESELSAPEKVTLKYVDFEQVKVSWDAVDGADGYLVIRRMGNTKEWLEIADVTENSFVDKNVTDSRTFYYRVQPYRIEGGKKVLGAYDEKGVSIYSRIAAPKLLTLTYTDFETVEFDWAAVYGADGYRIFRKKSGDTSWTWMADVPRSCYTDTDATDGNTYIYTAKPYAKTASGKVLGYNDTTGLTITSKVSAPELTSAEYTALETIEIKWNAAVGADGYYVYRRKAGTSSWTRIGMVTAPGFVDKEATDGTVYEYTVKPYSLVGTKKTWGNWDRAGISCSSELPAPKNVAASSYGFRRVKVTWDASLEANNYCVSRRKKGADKWEKLGYTEKTYYYDKTAVENTEYEYSVSANAVAPSGVIQSKSNEVITIKAVFAAPVMVSAKSVGYQTVDVKWKSVYGAEKYNVLRKTSGGSWTTVARDIEGLTYRDTTAKHGVKYIYTVRGVVEENGTDILGKYDTTGITVTVSFAAPTGLVLKNTASNKITVSWDELPGTRGYRVYRRSNAEESWKYIGYTRTTEYTDTVVCGETYSYTAAGYVTVNGETLVGKRNTAGVTGTAQPAAPVMEALPKEAVIIPLKWEKVEDADGYYLYRRENGGTWKRLMNSSKTEYSDDSATFGAKLEYKVKAYKLVNGEKVFGAYSKTLTSKRVRHVHFHQGDDAWGFSSRLEKNACVLSCFSMMLKNLGEDVNPKLVYAANGDDAGMEFDKALDYYDREFVCALSASSKYLADYDERWGWTYVKDPEKNATKAIREALDRNPEGVMCYFVKGNSMHGIVAIGYDSENIYYSDPGRVYDKGHNVTFNNTWCKKGHNMSYKHLSLIQAVG